ncbi:GYD domain-containing protein [Desulfococcus sp.]|uniref:GYD domain-containing protein n=1 Tax=Desulfococcus sp. TaxID=2025834 RepID=UPI0035947ACB
MPVFMMFGKYNAAAMAGISPRRTDKAVEIVKKNGGKVISMYAVMGEHDLVFTLDFPDLEKALTASVALNRLTGISFTTSPVVEVEKFDSLIAKAEHI